MNASANTHPDGLATPEQLRAAVRERYGNIAESRGKASCCAPVTGTSCCAGTTEDPISANLYDSTESGQVPHEALAASLGCGNPTALIELHEGETVLDLGSGGGIDVLLSARRVGPTGRAYGLDMTDQMLSLARENARRAGASNVEFLEGEIEQIPLPDESVDVIISNCVINLSADKDRVLREAFRVLKPGGRFAVSDIVVRGEMPDAIRRSAELWVGCVAGALEESEYRRKLIAAGFESVEIEATRSYEIQADGEVSTSGGVEPGADDGSPSLISAFVRASKGR